MHKRAILDEIVAALATELETLASAARDARQAATDDESRAEDKHDTRAIEASYLADGQERAALEAQEALTAYRTLAVRSFAPGEPIALTALVTLDEGAASEFYFIGRSRGGLAVKLGDREVLVITPQSPIGRKLLGRVTGDVITLENGRPRRDVRITQVE